MPRPQATPGEIMSYFHGGESYPVTDTLNPILSGFKQRFENSGDSIDMIAENSLVTEREDYIKQCFVKICPENTRLCDCTFEMPYNPASFTYGNEQYRILYDDSNNESKISNSLMLNIKLVDANGDKMPATRENLQKNIIQYVELYVSPSKFGNDFNSEIHELMDILNILAYPKRTDKRIFYTNPPWEAYQLP